MSQDFNHQRIVKLMESKIAVRVTANQMVDLLGDKAIGERLCSCYPRKGDGIIVSLTFTRTDGKRWKPPNYQRMDDRVIAEAGPCVLV